MNSIALEAVGATTRYLLNKFGNVSVWLQDEQELQSILFIFRCIVSVGSENVGLTLHMEFLLTYDCLEEDESKFILLHMVKDAAVEYMTCIEE